jgi:hypothetical protein
VYGCLIPTQGETQIILLDVKMYLIQCFFKQETYALLLD